MKIASLMNKKIVIKEDMKRVRAENSEVDRLLCDNTKIRNITDWKPKYSLEEGLSETIEWFKKAERFYKSEIYNI